MHVMTSVHLNLSKILVVSHFLSANVFLMEVKAGFPDPEKMSLSPEKRCSFNRGNKCNWLF